jgi:hypothetical protein
MRPSFWSKVESDHLDPANIADGWYQEGENIEYSVSEYSGVINELNPSKQQVFM